MKTLVVGASTNPERYSYKAFHMLEKYGHEAIPLGIKKGILGKQDILLGHPPIENVDTITLYINNRIQETYYDYLLSLHPRRIIFNPGTENEAFVQICQKKGIEATIACTLVLLSTGQY